MSLPFSPSTGKLFTSTFDALDVQGILPTTPLPDSHPFTALWKEHLAALTSTQAGPYEAVIDAFVSIAEESPAWREEEGMSERKIAAKMNEMRDMLSQHPPDVVVVSGVTEYVTLWVDADKRRSDELARSRRLEKLALTALLKTSIDHEIGHWLFTLKIVYYSDAKNTSKLESVTWSAKEEAGNFVEVHSRGGIMSYSKEEKKAVLHTGSNPTDVHVLPLSYLRVYGNNHSTRGADSSQLWFTPSDERYLGDIFFPRKADDDHELPLTLALAIASRGHDHRGCVRQRKRPRNGVCRNYAPYSGYALRALM